MTGLVSRGDDDGERGFFQINAPTPRLPEMTPLEQIQWGMGHVRSGLFDLQPWEVAILERAQGPWGPRVAPGNLVGKTYFERGRPVVIVTQWNGKGPRNVKVRREDGSEVVRPFRGLRKDNPNG